jgi:hypothetical protein
LIFFFAAFLDLAGRTGCAVEPLPPPTWTDSVYSTVSNLWTREKQEDHDKKIVECLRRLDYNDLLQYTMMLPNKGYFEGLYPTNPWVSVFVILNLHFVTFSSQVSLRNSGDSPREEHDSDGVAPTQDIGGIEPF